MQKKSKLVLVVLSFIFTIFSCSKNESPNTAPVVLNKEIQFNLNNVRIASDSEYSIGFIEAMDAEGDEINFTILSQNPSEAVYVNEATGELFINNTDYFDGSYTTIEIEVSVNDGEAYNDGNFIIIDLEEEE